MKLSIITVNLNNREGLLKTIDSVVAQTFSDFEWIVIDGGSTDGSRELIEEYASHFSYWVSESDKGIYNAMNKGVVEAKGEYLLFLNSGDWLFSDSTLDEVSILLEGDVVYGDANHWEHGKFKCSQHPGTMSLRLLYTSFICHQSTFFKRSLFDVNRYNEELKIVSDWELCIKLLFKKSTFKYIPVTVCNFEGGGKSSMDSDLLKRERAYVLGQYCPDAICEDFRIIACAETHLANTKLTEFSSLCERNKLLAKIITAIVVLMKKMGR